MYIEILSYSQNKSSRLDDLRRIFFATAQVPLKTEEEREKLFWRYAGIYTQNWPDDTFFACHLDTNETMGYLLGCRDSRKAADLLTPLTNSYALFSDLFDRYPAHLHMDVDPAFQGRGIGSFLLQEYIIELKKFNVRGLHIVTAPELRNANFYLKHKMKHQVVREYNGRPLMFMGLSF